MKKTKILIIMLIILCIVAISICIIIKNVINKNPEKLGIIIEDEEADTSTLNKESTVTNSAYFYMVQDCLNKYLFDANLLDETLEQREKVYNQLSKKYIKDNNITVNNVNQYAKVEGQNVSSYIVDMKQFEGSNKQVIQYVVKALVFETTTEEMNLETINENVNTEFFKVCLDYYNKTYSVEPILKNISKIDEINIKDEIESIDKNDNNMQNEEMDIDTQELLENYLSFYITIMLKDSVLAYDYLDEDYKKLRFRTIEEFKQYVEYNKDNLYLTTLDKYKEINKDEYNEYVCLDEDGKYYIFKETSVMKFTVQLDNYTINSEDFLNKYNNGDEQMKVGMNIEKVISAINNKDYNYVYGKLDETFKNNNYGNVESLEEYLNENLYDINKAEYDKFSKEGNTYIYELKIKSAEQEEDYKNVTIIMKLLEDTNFVMSFSIN